MLRGQEVAVTAKSKGLNQSERKVCKDQCREDFSAERIRGGGGDMTDNVAVNPNPTKEKEASSPPQQPQANNEAVMHEDEKEPTTCSSPATVESTRATTDESHNAAQTSYRFSETPKCTKCAKRWARKLCSQTACLTCCTDANCTGHKEIRERALQEQAILEGTSEINLLAKKKRCLAITRNSFREDSFRYMGETAVLWSLRDFLATPKWRDDAVRKSKKRHERNVVTSSTMRTTTGSRKRFKQVMEDLYQKSLES